ncbi:hypothetical protein REC12_16540 [Desulfosporosinus sp. PR]|uniref:hypothetical protein n=1 Tax=Candidatus Desulfosporosinus nitrosoreducens TaxID=3401928 RepID=UPI0027F66EBA|nr:hypothetical protein [Desulfosporosinus sp. PR]MDQ7095207.1 hypothetical protein [Desulfosporosinus sp. PR]
MIENESSCSCKCKKDSNNTPVLLGGIIVYELAIAIILLICILWELKKPCGCEPCGGESCGCKTKNDLIELSPLAE